MDCPRKTILSLETLAWGALFIWWGIRWLFEFLPDGTGLLGTGIILLGLNAARSRNGIPTRCFTTTLGVLALVSGGLLLASSVLHLSLEQPVLGFVLIVCGAIVVGYGGPPGGTRRAAGEVTGGFQNAEDADQDFLDSDCEGCFLPGPGEPRGSLSNSTSRKLHK